ncbi:hypothetical protein EVAR_75_1 [Eumeta japonica]|uniref:Uncharacterized protein n=1 Tax=Eumeta variegata TaxID=151549 RepID=A0A4C1SBH1_EUMVA|nr:hypothetical protein EVAR_75_1 [Eumeta japonica]
MTICSRDIDSYKTTTLSRGLEIARFAITYGKIDARRGFSCWLFVAVHERFSIRHEHKTQRDTSMRYTMSVPNVYCLPPEDIEKILSYYVGGVLLHVASQIRQRPLSQGNNVNPSALIYQLAYHQSA